MGGRHTPSQARPATSTDHTSPRTAPEELVCPACGQLTQPLTDGSGRCPDCAVGLLPVDPQQQGGADILCPTPPHAGDRAPHPNTRSTTMTLPPLTRSAAHACPLDVFGDDFGRLDLHAASKVITDLLDMARDEEFLDLHGPAWNTGGVSTQAAWPTTPNCCQTPATAPLRTHSARRIQASASKPQQSTLDPPGGHPPRRPALQLVAHRCRTDRLSPHSDNHDSRANPPPGERPRMDPAGADRAHLTDRPHRRPGRLAQLLHTVAATARIPDLPPPPPPAGRSRGRRGQHHPPGSPCARSRHQPQFRLIPLERERS